MTTPKGPNPLDPELEAEIERSLGGMSIEDLVDAPPTGETGPRMMTGTIVSIRDADVFVEFSPRTQGVCPIDHFDEPPTQGDQMEFVVDRHDKQDGLLVLSRAGRVGKAQRGNLTLGQTVEARCTGTNKGGLEMEVAGERAFMPAGQVDLRHIPDLNIFVGEKLPCQITELDLSRKRIVLSRREVLAIEREEKRAKLLETLEVGQRVSALITKIMPYGAFADIGGIEGLIHISDLCHQRIHKPEEVVKDGQMVEAQVLKLELELDPPRISLGMKQLASDPYVSATGELTEGATVTGRVSKIAEFGAFVELTPGVEGLIHISQLSHDRVGKVSQVVKVDQIVTIKVLDVDHGRRRISLSLKAMTEAGAPDMNQDRPEDPALRKLRAKFGDGQDLKGGLV
ncbi:MAG: S1 RNA-binding domain-containing protein [Phycisphaerales bacterium]|nr:S1 RNA-binding domain-containing protein [Phycisphaerales bacterium]